MAWNRSYFLKNSFALAEEHNKSRAADQKEQFHNDFKRQFFQFKEINIRSGESILRDKITVLTIDNKQHVRWHTRGESKDQSIEDLEKKPEELRRIQVDYFVNEEILEATKKYIHQGIGASAFRYSHLTKKGEKDKLARPTSPITTITFYRVRDINKDRWDFFISVKTHTLCATVEDRDGDIQFTARSQIEDKKNNGAPPDTKQFSPLTGGKILSEIRTKHMNGQAALLSSFIESYRIDYSNPHRPLLSPLSPPELFIYGIDYEPAYSESFLDTGAPKPNISLSTSTAEKARNIVTTERAILRDGQDVISAALCEEEINKGLVPVRADEGEENAETFLSSLSKSPQGQVSHLLDSGDLVEDFNRSVEAAPSPASPPPPRSSSPSFTSSSSSASRTSSRSSDSDQPNSDKEKNEGSKQKDDSLRIRLTHLYAESKSQEEIKQSIESINGMRQAITAGKALLLPLDSDEYKYYLKAEKSLDNFENILFSDAVTPQKKLTAKIQADTVLQEIEKLFNDPEAPKESKYWQTFVLCGIILVGTLLGAVLGHVFLPSLIMAKTKIGTEIGAVMGAAITTAGTAITNYCGFFKKAPSNQDAEAKGINNYKATIEENARKLTHSLL